ncbi:DUF2878 domain-containing protein [Catenovulum maritimum]|uniref:DUF2878 domain-containing protein n=1 Tax=Catenovulum maritimum TaxID=1513271 RepID=UPI00065FEBFD|nr:DUF2878 domain-containing protein [Catenovulum maritimum]
MIANLTEQLRQRPWVITAYNLICFQACWFLAAIYQHNAVIWMFGLLLIHFLLSHSKRSDFRLLPIAVLGLFVDQILSIFQIVQFKTSQLDFSVINNLVPIWLALLWIALAISFNHSLAWLNRIKLRYVSLLGLVFGPASYYAGAQFNALTLSVSELNFLITYACIWSVLLPLCTLLASRLNK